MDNASPPLPRLHTALLHGGSRSVAFHEHPYSELISVEHGDVFVACQDQDYRAGVGTLYVLPPRVAHDQRNRGAWRTHCILYSGGEHLLASQPRTLDLRDDALSRRWIADLVELTSARDARAGDGLLLSLLTRLGTRDANNTAAATLPTPVTTALRFLDEHLTRELSDEHVAHAAGVSVSHLGGLFRHHVGCGPLRHLQRLRLDRAANLLRNPYLSLREIATACGYRDINYFTRHFRRAHGLPPARWRKRGMDQSNKPKTTPIR
ncbi:MAG: AraC family transcriptional regulator [Planctomycetota bacterium]